MIGVDGEWRGIEVRALPNQYQVSDFEPTDTPASTLAGRETDGTVSGTRDSDAHSSDEE